MAGGRRRGDGEMEALTAPPKGGGVCSASAGSDQAKITGPAWLELPVFPEKLELEIHFLNCIKVDIISLF